MRELLSPDQTALNIVTVKSWSIRENIQSLSGKRVSISHCMKCGTKAECRASHLTQSVKETIVIIGHVKSHGRFFKLCFKLCMYSIYICALALKSKNHYLLLLLLLILKTFYKSVENLTIKVNLKSKLFLFKKGKFIFSE